MGEIRADGAPVKILTLDIETSPNIADVWALFNQNISINQIRQSSTVLSVAAKWHDETTPIFYSDYHHGHNLMVNSVHTLLELADIVVHYNGKRFDVPHLYREFLLADLPPPAPVQQVDLFDVVKSQFNFVSNKLDYVAQQLELGGKVKHEGHTLWVKCMARDPHAWERMKEYNIGDVLLTEKLYDRLRPWIKGHPHVGLYVDNGTLCPNCGGSELTRQGYALTALSKFQRYRCNSCGAWSRGKTAVARVDLRSVA